MFEYRYGATREGNHGNFPRLPGWISRKQTQILSLFDRSAHPCNCYLHDNHNCTCMPWVCPGSQNDTQRYFPDFRKKYCLFCFCCYRPMLPFWIRVPRVDEFPRVDDSFPRECSTVIVISGTTATGPQKTRRQHQNAHRLQHQS